MEVVGGISGIITLVSAVTKLAKQLNDVRDRYNSVALNTTLVASQLNTIRAALEALHEWRSNDRTDTDQSKQLDTDLGVSLSCCAILITVIDGKLGESGYTPGMKQKIRYVWLEDILKEYLSNLEGQVRALQLLLTIYQCKTATEQRQRLERAESRRIIENVRVETQTLRTENKDFSDAASVLSLDPSVNFDFDAVLMRHPAYVTVYGERPLPPVPKVPAQRTPPPVPDRALKPPPVPPPPPPRRRKPVWNLYLGQAVDVGTVSRTDSGEAGGRPNEQDYGKTAEQHLPAEQLPKSASTFAEPPGSTGNVNELLDEKVGAKATEQDTSIDHNHGRTPRIAETLGGNGNTAYASPPLVDSVPSKIGDSVTSLSAIDGLRGEMDLAFGSKQQSEVLKQHSRLSTASLRLSAESLVETPGVRKAATSLASSPQSPGWLGGHSRTASKQNDPEIPISQPAGSDDFHDQLRPNGSPQLEIVAHHESIKDARPSSLDSDLYSATTRSASLTSVNREPETSVGRDAPTTSQVAATTIGNQGSIAKRPEDVSESRDANPERSSAISNYLATTTVFEVLNPGLKRQSNPKEDPISSQPTDFSQIPADRGSPSGLGLDPQIIQNTRTGDINRQGSANSGSSATKQAIPPPPRRRPPIPSTPPPIAPEISSPSSQPPPTPKSAITGSDFSSLASQRGSLTSGTASTVSSSEFPEVNTAFSIQYSNNTASTSLGPDAPGSLREQGQIRLRNLQSELAAAKARGDSKSQEEAIQKSIDVIWRSYLAPPTEPPAEASSLQSKSPSPKLKNRVSILRLPSMTSSSKGVSLGNAAAAGDVIIVTKLLEEKANANSTSHDFKTPLMRAAINGHINCLDVLKAFGADELAVDKAGSTALHHAVASNNVASVKWLISSYPPPPSDLLRHRSSILLRATDAAKWGRTQKNLREASDAGGSKPLHIAVEKDMGGTVITLLGAGVDIEAKNNWGRTPLQQAIITDHKDSFDTLLRHGAKIETLDGGSMSALHWAARCGQIGMIEILLEKGAARWEYDNAGALPIHQAAWEGQLPAVEALLTEKKDLDRLTKFGETLLHIAALRNHQSLAEYLLKNTVDVNPWTARAPIWNQIPRAKLIGSSLTPLHYASCLGHFEMAYLLLDHEAFVNAPTPDGYTPLMMAVETGNTDMVSLLHRRGAKVNASLPGNMMTALHMASKRGDIDTVRELCRAGADWKAGAGKESSKRTPYQEADLCPDKEKRQEVRQYFNTILNNELNKTRYNAAVGPGFGQQQSNTARATQAALAPVQQPVSYEPWRQQPNNPVQPYPIQHTQSAPASEWSNSGTYMNELMRPSMGHTQYFDPMAYETQVDSPPPYQPGNSMSARLASQAPVYRPKYS